MKVLSTTFEYKGAIIKVENGKVYTRIFGTTYYNQSMHWGWCEIPISELKEELVEYLKINNLI